MSKCTRHSLSEILTLERRPVNVVADQSYAEIGIYSFGKGIFHKQPRTGLEVGDKRLFAVREGDFILQITFAWEGAVGLASAAEDGMYGSVRFPTFRVNEELCFPPYLVHYFRTAEGTEQLARISPGSAGRNRVLGVKRLGEVLVPLPTLAEQRRVVARVEEVSSEVENAQALRREAAAEAERLASASARELLSDVEVPVSELRDWLDRDREGIQTGPFGAQLSSSDFVDSGVPVLTIGNVQYSGLVLNDLRHVTREKARRLERFALRKGDILFARMGTVGRCCVVPERGAGWLINYHIIRVALDATRVDPRYIHWTIRASRDVEEYLAEETRGATRAGVNSRIVGGLPCRVPALAQQRHIVSYLDELETSLETLRRVQAQTAGELQALLAAVLERAFSGEL